MNFHKINYNLNSSCKNIKGKLEIIENFKKYTKASLIEIILKNILNNNN